MADIAVVTGASEGIGRATAAMLAERGYTVYGLSRRGTSAGEVRALSCDITNEERVRACIDEIAGIEGRIDLLVNCAGIGISGAFEFTDPAAARRLMDVNVFGMSTCIRAVLPHMRSRGSGRIINVSSVAASAPIPFQAWYSISKAAVSSLTMCVDNEVRPFGITVCAVLPGDVHTGFTAARAKSLAGDEIYHGRVRRSVAVMEHDELTGKPPEFIASHIVRLASCRHPKPFTVPGAKYGGAYILLRLLPNRAIRYLISKLYGG